MKKILLTSAIIGSLALTGCNNDEKAAEETAKPAATEKKATLESTIEKVSYGIGISLGQNFQQQKVDLDKKAFNKGLEDGLAGNEPAISQEKIMEAMQKFQKEQIAKQDAEKTAIETKNKEEAAKFFEENGSKEGVTTTESGLQYKVLSEGDSDVKPTPEDTVVVHYRGTLLDGTEFDSSYSRNQPATFPLGNVIPGWTEGLQLMSVGDKYEFYIPSELAYGAGGAGAKIGPHAALIFEVELLEVVNKGSAKQAESAPSGEVSELKSEDLKGEAAE